MWAGCGRWVTEQLKLLLKVGDPAGSFSGCSALLDSNKGSFISVQTRSVAKTKQKTSITYWWGVALFSFFLPFLPSSLGLFLFCPTLCLCVCVCWRLKRWLDNCTSAFQSMCVSAESHTIESLSSDRRDKAAVIAPQGLQFGCILYLSRVLLNNRTAISKISLLCYFLQISVYMFQGLSGNRTTAVASW